MTRLLGIVGRLGLVAVVALSALSSCRRQPPAADAPPAQLSEVEKQVQIEHEGRWLKGVAGASLAIGDAVRTGPASSARLQFSKGGDLRLAESSLLRLGADAQSSFHITIELGEAEIEGDGGLVVNTSRGLARLDPGTQLRVRVDDQGTRYEVTVGRALIGEGTGAVALADGDGLILRMGSSEMERYRVDVGEAQVERGPAGAATAAGAGGASGDGGRDREARRRAGADSETMPGEGGMVATGPVDVSVPAGESAILHGPQTPVAVRLWLSSPCPAAAVLSLESPGRRRRQAIPKGEARLALPAGAHRYRVECPGGRALTGRLDVRRDSGNLRLVKRAPLNLIETDGRRYTVLYQNRPPALTLRWPGAPRVAGYVLHVAVGSQEKTYPSDVPELHLPSGVLPEGAHSLWFSADGQNRHSAKTAVTIRFDNAAVAAEIDRPRDGARIEAGATVDVAGVALQGSTVAVGVSSLPIDEHGRFRGQVPAPTGDERSIAIRTHHPKGGVHYYIRRVEEAP